MADLYLKESRIQLFTRGHAFILGKTLQYSSDQTKDLEFLGTNAAQLFVLQFIYGKIKHTPGGALI